MALTVSLKLYIHLPTHWPSSSTYRVFSHQTKNTCLPKNLYKKVHSSFTIDKNWNVQMSIKRMLKTVSSLTITKQWKRMGVWSMQWYGCWVKEGRYQWIYMVWFHLYEILEQVRLVSGIRMVISLRWWWEGLEGGWGD